ncbi:MAG: glycosyltransferase family 4 protein [Candidatus Bruticola sp.]
MNRSTPIDITGLEKSGTGKKVLVVTTIDLTAQCFLRRKFEAMVACGYEVTLACTVQKFRQPLESLGIKVVNIPISRRISPLQDICSLIKLIKFIRQYKPDIIHTHTSKAGFIGRLAGFLCGVPLRLHTIHELPENAATNLYLKFLYRILEKIAARLACFHFTVSTPNLKQIISEGIVPAHKLAIVREGCLDLDRYQPCGSPAELRRKLQIPSDSFIIDSVGRLEEAKGHDILIKAFSIFLQKLAPQEASKVYLVIVGQGRLRRQLEELIDELKLQKQVILVGWADNLLEYLGNFDIYALNSNYEGLGIANLEAMIMHRPVVCTAVGGVIDVVDHQKNGLLVPPKNPEATAQALFELYSKPEYATQLAERGYAKAISEFQEAPQARKLMEYYAKLLPQYQLN